MCIRDSACVTLKSNTANKGEEVNTLVKEKSVLEMRNIHKSFPGVRALQAVDFTLCEGEIHALMGENLSLIHILAISENLCTPRIRHLPEA